MIIIMMIIIRSTHNYKARRRVAAGGGPARPLGGAVREIARGAGVIRYHGGLRHGVETQHEHLDGHVGRVICNTQVPDGQVKVTGKYVTSMNVTDAWSCWSDTL